jgi:CDP-diacylglycerol--glycerol-3-phosphate 3-phosphatidyltransferase
VNGSIVSPELRARVRGVATPIAVGFGRLGLTPNHLTLIGFGIAIVAAAAAWGEAWLAAGVLVLVGGVFDLFDGALARATGRTSRLGAFMDSVADRAGEGVVYIGIIAGCLWSGLREGVVLGAAAMAAAFLVSYVRAKSESLGFTSGTGMAAVGVAPREMRIVILALGLVLAGIGGGAGRYPVPAGQVRIDEPFLGGTMPLLAALGLIAVLATVTTIQRIAHVIRQTPQE